MLLLSSKHSNTYKLFYSNSNTHETYVKPCAVVEQEQVLDSRHIQKQNLILLLHFSALSLDSLSESRTLRSVLLSLRGSTTTKQVTLSLLQSHNYCQVSRNTRIEAIFGIVIVLGKDTVNKWLFCRDVSRILDYSSVIIYFISLVKLKVNRVCIIRILFDHKRHPLWPIVFSTYENIRRQNVITSVC